MTSFWGGRQAIGIMLSAVVRWQVARFRDNSLSLKRPLKWG
jgi:hypothetical protein